MSDKGTKELRKQLRNIVKELLPEILTKELIVEGHKNVSISVDRRLEAVEKHIKSVLEQIDTRSKDTQSYVVRQLGAIQVPAPHNLPKANENEEK